MTGPSVVLVEDDAELRALVRRGLDEEGFRVRTASTGAEMLEQVESELPDVMVIDIGLPDSDGRDLCQALRARGLQMPILFLTARDALVDRIAGFDAGGDDYLSKPFAFVELVARLQALVRRGAGSQVVELGGLRLDPMAHEIQHDGIALSLTPTEFRIVAKLLSRPHEAIRRRELVRAGWPHGAIVSENTLDTYIARLRRKLRSLDGSWAIVTIHGVGYRLE